ncbi:HlyD family secretion protein [Azospirillum canadense]|uniref:HlyD family secretion protein n=1 Tax=Azospirillum canadense TaxID=403962 RepID=UPI002225E804|nr:HlyD family secretion protein [Azospirillum canadense]MCW2241665.1 membrane fusion protein (multidrug efflux system) [Azospirillum canadense]
MDVQSPTTDPLPSGPPVVSGQPPPATDRGPGTRSAEPRHRVGAWLLRLAILVITGGIVALFITRWDVWVGQASRQTTDNAYVRSDITPLSAHVEGYVRRVAVADFQLVKAGDLLVEIDDQDYQARVDQAEADVLGADAAIRNLKARKALQHAEIDQAQSVIDTTRADVDRTRLELSRQKTLLGTTYGTAQKVEQALADEKRFEAILARNEAELEGQRRQMGVLDTQEEQLRADAKAKKAALELARTNLGYTRIVAPVEGMVGERGVRAGQYLRPGTQVIAVVPLDNVWVNANYKETQLTRVAIGQKAEVTIDTFPGTVVTGRVDSVAPASGSQFSLLPPDNATGNFTKVVQRIPVKIRLDPGSPLAGRLRPGMSAIATILTDSAPVAP